MAKRSRRPTRGEPVAPAAASSRAGRHDQQLRRRPPRTTTRSTRVRPDALASRRFFERYRLADHRRPAVVGMLIIVVALLPGRRRAPATAATPCSRPGPVESITPRPADAHPDAAARARRRRRRHRRPGRRPHRARRRVGFAAPHRARRPLGIAGRVGFAVGQSASPTPAPTPVPEPTPRLGFTTTDLGGHAT